MFTSFSGSLVSRIPGAVQIVKTGEVIGATQLTEGELIVEAGGRAENTVVTGAGWLKVAT
ncbi:hypothetical protein NX040_28065, partial [Escherichia coli]|nr:hypothetical protein [Escherichia coli]